jgi:hypothetical protein
MQTSKKQVDASRFLYHLLFCSPNPWKLEQEYLQELSTVSDTASQISKAHFSSLEIISFNQLIVDELSGVEPPDVPDWSSRLSACLPPLAHGAASVLPSLTNLASHYFNHVGLACLPVSSPPWL